MNYLFEYAQLINASRYGFIIGRLEIKRPEYEFTFYNYFDDLNMTESNYENLYELHLVLRTDLFPSTHDIIKIGEGNEASLNDTYLHDLIIEQNVREVIPIQPLINIVGEY